MGSNHHIHLISFSQDADVSDSAPVTKTGASPRKKGDEPSMKKIVDMLYDKVGCAGAVHGRCANLTWV